VKVLWSEQSICKQIISRKSIFIKAFRKRDEKISTFWLASGPIRGRPEARQRVVHDPDRCPVFGRGNPGVDNDGRIW
jgi:hypothetical protein